MCTAASKDGTLLATEGNEEPAPMSDQKACLAICEDRESGIFVRGSKEITQVPPRANASTDISEIQDLLRRLRDQVCEVNQLRGRMPTLPPTSVDADGVGMAEVGLRSLRRTG
jgi:hypothetical protein